MAFEKITQPSFPGRGSDRVSLARLFKANGVKLSVDALEILDESQFHRMRPFYTRILSSWLMARRSLLKELVQFIPDRFQILPRVSQQRHHTVAQADITQRPIDTGFNLRLSLLVAFVHSRLRTFRQDTFKRRQKDHCIEVLLDGALAQSA